MAYWTEEFHRAVRKCVREAWPEVRGAKHPIYRATQAQRRAWRSLLEPPSDPPRDPGIETPWVSYQYTPFERDPEIPSPNVAFRTRVTVHYFCRTADAGELEVAHFVEQKLGELMTIVRAQTGWPGLAHIDGGEALDATEEHPVNREWAGANHPMFAGSLSFDCRTGTGPYFDTDNACGDDEEEDP